MPTDPVVILTQEEADNARLAKLLDGKGIKVIHYPCIETSYLPIDLETDLDGRRLEYYRVIAFTSRRAVISVASIAKQIREASPVIACVGDSTAREVHETLGIEASIIPVDEKMATALAEEIINRFSEPVPLLHVRGTRTTGTLKGTLIAGGWDVDELIVYKNNPPELKPLKTELPAVAYFASPTAVNRFFDTNPGLTDKLTCIAIGPVTANALAEAGITAVRQANEPDQQVIVDLIEKVIREDTSNDI